VWTEFLEQLKSKCGIVDVVRRYVGVEQKGRNFWACCPFHHEKTPSFSINPDGFYYCFGCKEGGDVIKFVQTFESVDFMEAVKILAKSVSLEVPAFKEDKGAEDIKRKKELYGAICVDTAKFYHSNLSSGGAAQALKYLQNRGVEKSAITKFGIGVSTGFKELVKFLQDKGYNLEDCVAAGVLSKNENERYEDKGYSLEEYTGAGVPSKSEAGHYFDALGERLIFPIINVYGAVVGFGGRVLDKNSTFAKYKNTAAGLLFDKSKNLYAVNLLKKLKRTGPLNAIIVVEGYMDVLSLVQAGFSNCAASMGTSLTSEQARLIKRFCDDVFISYDGDAAGQAATLRGLDILKNEGVNVKVVVLPEGLDPDELIKKYGAAVYQKCLDNALPLTDYRLKMLKEGFDFNTDNPIKIEEAKRGYISEALKIIKRLDDVERESYTKLLQKQTGYTLDFLKREQTDIISGGYSDENTARIVTILMSADETAVRFILSSLIFEKDYVDKSFDISPFLSENCFVQIYDYIKDCHKKNKKPMPSLLYDITDKESEDEVNAILNLDLEANPQNKKYYDDCVKMLSGRSINRKIASLNLIFENEKDMARRKEIAKEIQELTKQKNNYHGGM
jgi:DNA primase